MLGLKITRGLVAAALITIAAGPAAAADQEMIDAAKKEGEVTWYTTLIVNQLVRPAAAAFEAKYGIKVNYARANSTETAIKILQEAEAGKVQVDVFDGTSTVGPLKDRGLVAKWVPDRAEDLPAQYSDKEGFWISTNVYLMTPAYNTQMVPEGEQPKTYEDLLDPKWKGAMAWTGTATASGGPGFVGVVLASMGEEKGMDYLKELSKQNIANLSVSARQVLDRSIAGEYPVVLQTFNHHAVLSAAKGAPSKWIPFNPVMKNLSVMGTMKAAPHPNAAKLLVDFLVSEEGQNIFREAGYLPMDPGVPALTPELKPEAGGFEAIAFSPEQIQENLPKWTEIFGEIFR